MISKRKGHPILVVFPPRRIFAQCVRRACSPDRHPHLPLFHRSRHSAPCSARRRAFLRVPLQVLLFPVAVPPTTLSDGYRPTTRVNTLYLLRPLPKGGEGVCSIHEMGTSDDPP